LRLNEGSAAGQAAKYQAQGFTKAKALKGAWPPGERRATPSRRRRKPRPRFHRAPWSPDQGAFFLDERAQIERAAAPSAPP